MMTWQSAFFFWVQFHKRHSGNDMDALFAGLFPGGRDKRKTNVIIANTTKGFGSPVMENNGKLGHHKVPTPGGNMNQIASAISLQKRRLPF